MRDRTRVLTRARRHWLVLVLGMAVAALPTPAAAQVVAGSGTWSPGPNAAGDNTYAGNIDQPASGSTIAAGSAFHVAGWVVDTTAEGWAGIDEINVYLGSAGPGGTFVGRGTVAANRPDVAAVTSNGFWAASGFDALIPAGAVPAGNATLTVYAHTPGKGWWSKQIGVTVGGAGAATSASPALQVTVLSPTPNQEVAGTTNGLIHGIVGDTRTRAELGSGVDRVQVYLDAQRGLAGSQLIGTATIIGNTWRLEWQPTKYNGVRHHVMYVYGRSAVTGEERLVTQDIDISS